MNGDGEIYVPGRVKHMKKENVLAIRCKDGFVYFKSIIFKKKLSSQDFYNGYMNNKGVIVFESVSNKIKDNLFKTKV